MQYSMYGAAMTMWHIVAGSNAVIYREVEYLWAVG